MANLVVCCDGTWNTPDDTDGGMPAPTNVRRLFNALADKDDSGTAQKKYYHPGVGTSGRWWKRIAGGGGGAGLADNVKSAYQWLAYNYRPGDNIFLFGFSRGAFTVRSLSGMIDCCG
ncbi:MAG: phospholipase effector Tle1 domain-containing protein, partial [Rhodoplanes sp.]